MSAGSPSPSQLAADASPPSTGPAPVLPPTPSRAGPTVAAVLLGAVVLVSVAGLDIAWGSLGEIPVRVVTYLELLFSAPNWEKLPRALFETWRSVSMAWLGAIGCVALSIPLGILAARGVGPAWLRTLLRGPSR